MLGPRGRAVILCCGLAVVFTLYSARLIQLQVRDSAHYTGMAADRHSRKQIIPARRGALLDRNGEVLATNEPVRTVVADGSLIKQDRIDELAGMLAGPLEMNLAELTADLRTKRRYLILKKQLPELVANDLQLQMATRGLRGIFFEHDSVRIYPNDSMLSHVLGFVDHEAVGQDGVERTMDRFLRGHDGFRYIERDRTGKEIVMYRGQERPPRHGNDVRISIDMGLQNIVENELDQAIAKYKPKGAMCIMMDPRTGEILAMTSRPTYDPNRPGATKIGDMRNRAVADQYEPGSIFKIVAASAALNEHLVGPQTVIFCENGRYRYGGSWLKDHHGYGDLTVSDGIKKSSNILAAKLAIQLGEERFHDYIRRYGFGEATGVALPGEIGGSVSVPSVWSKISITRIPMGHEIAVTPLQMVSAMAVVANGGNLMTPMLVEEIRSPQGEAVQKYGSVTVRRVISEKAAAQLRDALVTVVDKDGTAPLAKVPGFRVAGKTGTAQKPSPKGGYARGEYIVSFVGFMPAEDPAFVCLVTIDDAEVPSSENYGGLVAAPIFSRIAEKAARYLNLVPTPEEPLDPIVQGDTR